MNERFSSSSMQGMFSQVIKEIQGGLSRLEQAVQQQQQTPGTPPTDAPADGGFAPQTPPQQSAPATQPAEPETPWTGVRWEYKVVYVNFRGQISSDGQQKTIERGARRSSFVREHLDELGQQGWDLAGVSPLGETENSYFVFKRPAVGPAKPKAASNTTSASNGTKVQIEEVDDSSMML